MDKWSWPVVNKTVSKQTTNYGQNQSCQIKEIEWKTEILCLNLIWQFYTVDFHCIPVSSLRTEEGMLYPTPNGGQSVWNKNGWMIPCIILLMHPELS